MSITQFYLIVSAVSVLLWDKLYPLFRQSYSWWLVPLVFLGIFLLLFVLHFCLFAAIILSAKKRKDGEFREEKFFRFMVKLTLPVIVSLARVKIKTQGLEQFPENRNVLLVCNHQHDFDPVIIIHCLSNAKFSFIGKKDILKEMPFIAKAMHLLSCLFIDRENDREAAKTVINAIKYLKEDKCSVGLFPEGYCSKTCELQPLRNGSLKIALKSKVPVAICVVNNTREIPKRMFRKKTEVDFRLLEVIEPEFYENMSTAELGNYIYDKMNTSLKELRG